MPNRRSQDLSDDKNLLIARDSFRGTGTEGIDYSLQPRTESTIISDAGDQQFKLQTSNYARDSIFTSEPLADQLFESLVESCDTRKKKFIPKATLNKLISFKSVSLELERSLPRLSVDENEELARKICNKTQVTLKDGKERIRTFRAIFALLVMLERPQFIMSFIDEKVSDLDLPLVFSEDKPSQLRRRDSSGGPTGGRLHCFDDWQRFMVRHFEEDQWLVLAPFFSQKKSGSVPHYTLNRQHILPFLAIEGKDTDNAGSTPVYMVQIHDEHHEFPSPWLCSRGFAIKELPKDEKEEYKREVEILKKFTGDRAHPHIVTLLATYEQFDKYNLVFYRADGNLYDYMKTINPHPVFGYENVLFLAEQCAGMASGLLRLHRHYTFRQASMIPSHLEEEELKRRFSGNISSSDQQQEALRPAHLVNRPVDNSDNIVQQYGRHGDLKPENILWYPDRRPAGKGTLQITDFGASELNSCHTKTKRRSNIPYTRTYSPPECYVHHRVIRQSYDIWSLACIYLEFIAWMLGGRELLLEFAAKRLAYDVFQGMKTDIFWELVRDTATSKSLARVKLAVIKVCRPPPLLRAR